REPELAARVHARLEAALDRAAAILRRHRPTFNTLAKALFEEQAMDEKAVLRILADGELRR
ncbi:ATP-dependent Zn protease, partial [Agrobacterium radiobacter]